MSEKILYGYTALFDTPDDIIHAAEKVSLRDYTKFDVNTPYPVHGMDSAMKLNPSRLPYIALVIGLSAMMRNVLALFMMDWMITIDYPVIVGGKPFLSIPSIDSNSFLKLQFYLASVGTVVSHDIRFFLSFQILNHPFMILIYMKNVSSDKYGICIEADDSKFNEQKCKSLFYCQLEQSILNQLF